MKPRDICKASNLVLVANLRVWRSMIPSPAQLSVNIAGKMNGSPVNKSANFQGNITSMLAATSFSDMKIQEMERHEYLSGFARHAEIHPVLGMELIWNSCVASSHSKSQKRKRDTAFMAMHRVMNFWHLYSTISNNIMAIFRRVFSVDPVSLYRVCSEIDPIPENIDTTQPWRFCFPIAVEDVDFAASQMETFADMLREERYRFEKFLRENLPAKTGKKVIKNLTENAGVSNAGLTWQLVDPEVFANQRFML